MALAAADLQALTDRLAARVEPAVPTAALNMLATNANSGLARYLDDTSGDPMAQAALLSLCAAVDRQVLQANLWTYVDEQLGSAKWRALCAGFSDYVKSTDGGAYASLAAYLAA